MICRLPKRSDAHPISGVEISWPRPNVNIIVETAAPGAIVLCVAAQPPGAVALLGAQRKS